MLRKHHQYILIVANDLLWHILNRSSEEHFEWDFDFLNRDIYLRCLVLPESFLGSVFEQCSITALHLINETLYSWWLTVHPSFNCLWSLHLSVIYRFQTPGRRHSDSSQPSGELWASRSPADQTSDPHYSSLCVQRSGRLAYTAQESTGHGRMGGECSAGESGMFVYAGYV